LFVLVEKCVGKGTKFFLIIVLQSEKVAKKAASFRNNTTLNYV